MPVGPPKRETSPMSHPSRRRSGGSLAAPAAARSITSYKQRSRLVGCVLMLAALSGCGDNAFAPEPLVGDTPPAEYSLSVTPSTAALAAGQTTELKAASSSTEWTSSAPHIAKVDSKGVVTALSPGSATITATEKATGNGQTRGKKGKAEIVVTEPTPEPSPGPTSTSSAELPRVYLDTRYVAAVRTVSVPAGADLQAAINAAQPGDELVLAAGATYTGNFVLPLKAGAGWITIRSGGTLPAEGTRVTPSSAASFAKIVSPNALSAIRTAPGARRYRLMGLEVTYAPTVTQAYTLVALGDASSAQNSLDKVPADLIVDRSYVHGHSNVGFQRCIGLNSAASAVVDSWISECHMKGFDSQAIWGSNGPGPFKIVNNHLAGAGENVMFGGSDAYSPDLAPRDIEIRRNHFFKPLSWQGVWTIKNLFEIKSAQRILIEGNVFENNWLDGQTGQAIVLKGDPGLNARTEDITFRYNIIRNSLSGVTLHPNPNGGLPMVRVYMGHNVWEKMGKASGFSGGARMWQLLGALTDATIEHNTSTGGWGNQVVAEGSGKQRVIFRANKIDAGDYGFGNFDMLPATAGNVGSGSWLAPAAFNHGAVAEANCIASTDGSAPAACSNAGADRARVDAATVGVVVQP